MDHLSIPEIYGYMGRTGTVGGKKHQVPWLQILEFYWISGLDLPISTARQLYAG